MSFIQYIARIQFGLESRLTIPLELELAGIRRPLIVADRGLEATGVLARAVEAIEGSHYPRFLDVPTPPTEEAVLAGLARYRAEGCDGVLAIGGGSAMDAGKAIALLATHQGPLVRFLARTGGSASIGRLAPIVAVPTTAGTGSEIGRGASVTLDDGEKGVFLSPQLVPVAAVCDPELTIGLPPRLTAATGIDAFTHAFEAFTSAAYNPPADAIALDAIARIRAMLPRAVSQGGDLEVRSEVMMGATEAAMTTWKGLGATHALSMPFDDLGLHHGTVVGVVLPHTVRSLRRAVPAERFERLCAALDSSPDGLEDDLLAFARSLGLPGGLAELGVDRGFLPTAAAIAETTPFNQTVPRRLSTAEYLQIAEAAW